MTTEEQLRETLGVHVGQAPATDDRLGQVRRRIRVRRQRRAAGAALGLAVVVAGVLVPVTAAHHGSTSRIQPVVGPSTPPVVTVGPPVTNPEYANGGRKLAGAIATSPAAGSLTYTFTPTSYRLLVSEGCTTSGSVLSVTVDGHATTAATCSPGGSSAAGNLADASGSTAYWSPIVHLGRPNTVVVTLVSDLTPSLSGTPVPRAKRQPGTFASAIYQAVPVADYPLPPRPANIQPLQALGGVPVVLDSRRVGADGTFGLPVTVGARNTLDVVGVAPGQVTLSVGGHQLAVDAFWTYTGATYGGLGLDPTSLRTDGVTAYDGEHLTVTVTATRFSGPYWLIDAGHDG